MNRVIGRVITRETGAGVEELTVVLYHLDAGMDVKRLRELVGRESDENLWRKVSGRRLGSVLTDHRGAFALEYDDGAFLTDDGVQRPNLGLFVLTAEDPGVRLCPRVLHASCGYRPDAGRTESFLISLPLAVLREAQISGGWSAAEMLLATRAKDLVARMAVLAEKRDQARRSAARFSERYEERAEVLALRANAAGRLEDRVTPADRFSVALPVRLLNHEGAVPDAVVAHDPDTGDLSFHLGGEPPIPLTFTGVTYVSSGARDVPREPRAAFLVDAAKREVRAYVSSSPTKLTLPEADPGELQRFYAQQRREWEREHRHVRGPETNATDQGATP